jgi:hypothetical protein
MIPYFPFPARILSTISRFYSVLEALAWVVNVAGALLRIHVVIMNRPPACPRLSDERGNKESYWSGRKVNLEGQMISVVLTLEVQLPSWQVFGVYFYTFMIV